MQKSPQINYLEIPSSNLEQSKTFFQTVFDWQFTDFGNEYSAFKNAGIEGGFYLTELTAKVDSGSVLIVFYTPEDLSELQNKILQAGGTIIKPTFTFPGGCRFHFADPNHNEYAVWSDHNCPE